MAQLLHHGAQVDIGARWDALLPCQDAQWEEAARCAARRATLSWGWAELAGHVLLLCCCSAAALLHAPGLTLPPHPAASPCRPTMPPHPARRLCARSPCCRSMLAIGAEVEVRVHRLRDPRLYRFPIQAAPADAALAALTSPPEAHQAPMDLRAMTM